MTDDPVITPEAGADLPAPTMGNGPQPGDDVSTDGEMTTMEAIARSQADLDAQAAKEAADKPVEKAEAPKRGPDGKFAGEKPKEQPKEQPETAPEPKAEKPAISPPGRFNDLAKADWSKASDAIRHEVARMEREMSEGIEKYKGEARAASERAAEARALFDMAEQNGLTVAEVIERYTAPERALVDNPQKALVDLAEAYMPGGIRAFIGQLTGTANQQEMELARLRQQNERLQQQAEAERRTAQQLDQEASLRQAQQIIDSARDQMPRFDELRESMHKLITGGMVDGANDTEILLQAYQMADRLNPGAAPAPQAPAAHTRAAATSLSGAPDRGSDPRDDAVLTTEEIIRKVMR